MAKMRLITRKGAIRLGVLFLLIVCTLVYMYFAMIVMPGRSYSGPLPAATERQKAIAGEMRAWVTVLADAEGGVGRVGNRSTYYPKRFAQAAAWIHDQLKSFGYETINEIPVQRGAPVPNMEVVVPGRSGSARASEIVVVGAHYDAFQGTPGADDNASGVAAVLWLARELRQSQPSCTLKFVLFVNEEPPAFWTPDMGSWVYARQCRARNDDIVAMISVESIGYYKDAKGSQKYPPPMNLMYPDTGDFIAFVSNFGSRALNRRAISIFREQVQFPSEGASPPGWIPGVGWSDHWAFWQEGYPGIMVTDTATFRNPNYHTPFDTPDTLDYDRMSRVVEGLEVIVRELAEIPKK